VLKVEEVRKEIKKEIETSKNEKRNRN